MLSSVKENPLYKIVNPESIAFFGASNNVSAMGTTQIHSEHLVLRGPSIRYIPVRRSFRDHFIQELLSRGVPIFPGSERAARAIKALTRYYELREEIVKAGRQRD